MPTVEIAGRELHYEDTGSGPAILFGHSYLWDRRMWARQVEHLAPRYRCIAPDVWAHGKSAIPPSPCDLAAMAEHHHQLTASLGIDRYAAIGLSLGGMWALHLALAHPDAVAALAVFDAAANAEPPVPRARYLSLLGGVLMVATIPKQILATVVMSFFAKKSQSTRLDLLKAFMADLEAVPRHRWDHLAAIGRAIFSRDDITAEIPRIACPTLVAVGEDDQWRSVRESEAMAAAIPGARLEVIPEAGHVSTVEQPELVNGLLDQFLGEHWPA